MDFLSIANTGRFHLITRALNYPALLQVDVSADTLLQLADVRISSMWGDDEETRDILVRSADDPTHLAIRDRVLDAMRRAVRDTPDSLTPLALQVLTGLAEE